MTPALFLVADLTSTDVIVLIGPEAHHAGTVKRLKIDELVLLADGRGGLAEAKVSSVSKDEVSFVVLNRRVVAELVPRFIVVQALAKGDRAELAVEMLTELGVDEIVPWSASRSISIWKGDKIAKGVAKWRRTALEAAKQTRRARVPLVAELASDADVAARIRLAGLAILLQEDAETSLTQVLAPWQRTGRHAEPAGPAPSEVLLVVGPEGGLAPQELALFEANGARAVHLGREVLRTSTAGAAALAVLSAATGRWR